MTAVDPVTLSRAAAEKLTLRIRQSGSELLTMVQEAHDRKAWAALGYKSWSAYVDAELPFSRSTSYRYLSSAPEQDALVAGGELSHGETNNSSNGELVDAVDVDQRPLDTITPDAVLPPPTKASGGARTTAPLPETSTGVAPTPPSPAPPDPPKNPTSHVPSLRQEASAAFRALHDATEGIGEKWTAEEATYWENRSKREMDAWRAAHGIASAPAEKPQRRQGTITRPQAAVLAGRAIEQLNGTAGRPSTRVTIPTIPAPKLAKRHADDCRCLSCVPPKAVAK